MSHGHHGGGGGGGGGYHAPHHQSVSHHASHAQSASHHASHPQSVGHGVWGRERHEHHDRFRWHSAFGPSYNSYGPRYGYQRFGCVSLLAVLVIAVVLLSLLQAWSLFLPIVILLALGLFFVIRAISRKTANSGAGANYQPA